MKGVGDIVDEAAFERRLSELVKEIGTIPASEKKKKLILLTKKSQDSQRKLRKSAGNLQESLDYLRVSIKYILFDLESTRRENTYLRKMLEENNK